VSILVSCKKENTPSPTITQSSTIVKKVFTPIVNTERLLPNLQSIESVSGKPKIDTFLLNDVSQNNLQIYMIFYPKADTAYMRLNWRVLGTIMFSSSSYEIIPGIAPTWGYWQVFQNINGLLPNTSYEVQIDSYNGYGNTTTEWQTFSTL
jgi:hypothetical protein